PLATPEQLDGGQHAIGHAIAAPRDAGRKEEAVGEALAVGVHEDARDFFGRQIGPSHVATAERRAVAARERAGVGLHDAHEARRAMTGVPHARDADGISRQHPPPRRTVLVVRLREHPDAGPEVHLDYYT